MTARHQRDACITRGATRHTSQKSTAASADTVVGVPASSLVPSSFWCCVLSSGASVSSSSSASEWLSLSIFSEPTVWLTAPRVALRPHSVILATCKPGCKRGFRPGLQLGFRQVSAGLRHAFDFFLSQTWSWTAAGSLVRARARQMECRKSRFKQVRSWLSTCLRPGLQGLE